MIGGKEGLVKIAKYLARRPKEEGIIHMMLTEFSLAYSLNQAVYFELDENERFFTSVQAVGSTTHEEIDKALREMEQKNMEDILEGYNPEADKNLNDKIKDFTFYAQVDSCIKRELMDSRSSTYEHKSGFELTSEDRKLIGLFGTKEFIAIPIRGNEEKLLGFVYGNNAVTGSPIEGNREEVNLALSLGSIGLQRILDEKEISKKTALEAVGKFTSQIAHELKNPLATIGGFARNTLKYLGNPDKTVLIKENVEIIKEEIIRLEQLLENNLMFARQRDPNPEKIDLYEICIEAAGLVLNTKGYNIAFFYEKDDFVLAYADYSQIKQVCLNLTKNAIEAMNLDSDNQDNRLDIILGYEYGTKTATASFTNSQYIPEEIRDKIFEPFFSTKSEGTGLGLAICREIIEKNDGIIECTSTKEKGTAFKIWLPKYSEQDCVHQD